MEISRGSLWSKWDLHVHTPDSIVSNYSGTKDEAWEAFIKDIEALPNNFKVIGINDYLFLDGYEKILKAWKKGRMANISLFLPVIELRLSLFGGSDSRLSKVNFHVIFSNELEVEVIKSQFITGLSREYQLNPKYNSNSSVRSAWRGYLSEEALKDLGKAIIESAPTSEQVNFSTPLIEGFNNFTLPFSSVKTLLESSLLRSKFLTAVGKTEWADVRWKDGSIADKKDVINYADLVFTASNTIAEYEKSKKALSQNGVNYRLLDCSDAHCLSTSKEKDRLGNCATWIKTDITFTGLRQAVKEFDNRVYVGEEPEQVKRVRQYPSKYIDRVSITKKPESKLEEKWFDIDIPLNPGLVAIIGNKGSGKSALAEVIGLLGCSSQEEKFSFLTKTKFRDPKKNTAKEFVGCLTWSNGESEIKFLSQSPEYDSLSLLRHLPQQYIESLCNEIPSGGKTEFDNLLEEIIYSFLPIEQRLGTNTLAELVSLKTKALQTNREEVLKSLYKLNEEIVAIEDAITQKYRSELKKAYFIKRKEWSELRKSSPTSVPKPDSNDPLRNPIIDKLRELDLTKGHLESMLTKVKGQLSSLRKDKANFQTFWSELERFELNIKQLMENNSSLISKLNLEQSLVTFDINWDLLAKAREKLAEEESILTEQISQSNNRSLSSAISYIDEEKLKIKIQLDRPSEQYEEYLCQLEIWKQCIKSCIGTQDDGNSLLGLRKRIYELDKLPTTLESLQIKRKELVTKLHSYLKQEAEIQTELYRPLQEYMDIQCIPKEYSLSVETTLVDTGFSDIFLDEYIKSNVSGSFSGVSEGRELINELIQSIDLTNKDDVLNLLDSINARLHRDYRCDPPKEVDLKNQLRKGKELHAVYNFLFSLSYLAPRYTLCFGGKPIYQLSPGEKGVLLLMFFLLAEQDKVPLIIDQPEDNLDNQTIYRALVKAFQTAKNNRQVIIVTHNPNLAVVCDADQVIVAHMNKETYEISYEAGSIENESINQALVDILEGTKPAFDNRNVTYNLYDFNL